MSNANRFIIAGPSWNISADDTTIGTAIFPEEATGDQFPATTEWRSMDDLLALLADGGVNDDGTDKVLDLGADQGIGYALLGTEDPRAYARGYASGGNLTVTNARISGGQLLNSWTDEGGGLYSHAFDFSLYDGATNTSGRQAIEDPQAYLVDDASTRSPVPAVWPSPPVEWEDHRRTFNPNWLELKSSDGVDACIVHTTGGDDQIGYGNTITGITITDSTVGTALKNKIDSLTGLGYSITGVYLYLHLGQNRIGVAKVTSVVDNGPTDYRINFDPVTSGPNLFYPGYLKMAILAHPSDVQNPGEYGLDIIANKIYYRPEHVSSPSNVHYGVKSVFLYSTPSTENCAVLFENCELFCMGHGATFVRTDGTTVLDFNKCFIHSFAEGFTASSVNQCIVDHWYGIATATAAKSSVASYAFTKNTYGPHADQRSCIYLNLNDGTTPREDMTMRPVLIEDNIFSLPRSTHGQGISLYENCWTKATIRHNIFRDCANTMSFQSNGPVWDLGTMTWENNLTCKTVAATILGGQQGHAWNSGTDGYVADALAQNKPQKINWRYNTVWASPELQTMENYQQSMAVNLIGVRKSEVNMQANILATYSPCINSSDAYGPSIAQNSGDNLLYANMVYAGWSSKDLADPTDLTSIMEEGSLKPQGSYASAAPDGERIGIRWQGTPPLNQLAALPKNWYLYYPAETLPVLDSNDLAPVFASEDNR